VLFRLFGVALQEGSPRLAVAVMVELQRKGMSV